MIKFFLSFLVLTIPQICQSPSLIWHPLTSQQDVIVHKKVCHISIFFPERWSLTLFAHWCPGTQVGEESVHSGSGSLYSSPSNTVEMPPTGSSRSSRLQSRAMTVFYVDTI